MVLVFRIILGVIRGLLRRNRRALFEDSVIRLRVLPTDADLYFHLNNGRYLSISDLGRLDLAMGNGLSSVMMKNRWFPVVATSMARFRFSIGLFQRFTLRTRIVGWDAKWLYIVHWFELDGRAAATILLKAVFLERRKTIPPARLFEEMGIVAEPERLPEWIRHWIETEEAIKPALNQAMEDSVEKIDREQAE